jgi:hypothetical protein
MNTIGLLLVCAVVSVVPGFFVLVFASSGYRSLRKSHARLVQTELALRTASPQEAPARLAERQPARAAYRRQRHTFWGCFWATICRLPRIT